MRGGLRNGVCVRSLSFGEEAVCLCCVYVCVKGGVEQLVRFSQTAGNGLENTPHLRRTKNYYQVYIWKTTTA